MMVETDASVKGQPREKILAEVDRYCMPTIRSTVEIKTASLGDDSILYGDLAMIKGLG